MGQGISFGDRYDSLFQFYGDLHAVSWRLLKAQALAESSLNPNARSNAGAIGLSQFMSATFAEWAGKLKLKNASAWNPEHAINCQAAYMAWLITQFGGRVEPAIAAYNWGITNVQRIAERQNWREYLPRETQSYLRRILTHWGSE